MMHSSVASHTPCSTQRRNLYATLFQLPYSVGKSRQGAPVRRIQKTALMNRRLSCAIPPHCPRCPGKCGSSNAQTSSDMSCLCIAVDIVIPPFFSWYDHYLRKFISCPHYLEGWIIMFVIRWNTLSIATLSSEVQHLMEREAFTWRAKSKTLARTIVEGINNSKELFGGDA